jgi:hypothetical protein
MLQWEDGCGQNAVSTKRRTLPPIACDHDAVTPLHGKTSHAHNFCIRKLAKIINFVSVLLVACSHGKMVGCCPQRSYGGSPYFLLFEGEFRRELTFGKDSNLRENMYGNILFYVRM